jgi:hypothetical protein
MKKSDLLREMETPMVLGIELDRTTLTPVRRPIRPSKPAPAPVAPAVAVPDLPLAKYPDFYTGQVTAFSFGTLATLTKLRRYDDLEKVNLQYVTFYLNNQDRPYENWHDVWAAFVEAGGWTL